MAGNDPFAEPDDSERTVIRPNPGGRRGAPAPAAQPGVPNYPQPAQPQAQPLGYGVPQQAPPQAAAAPAAKAAEAPIQLAMTGMNRLNAAAAMLFALVSRIRNRAQHMDPDALRGKVVAEVRAFDSRAIAAGIDPQQVKVARYAICATIDDVVLNTPWGEQSNWALQSMVGTFHRETVGGDRLYDVLARLEKDPPNNIELLEFIYMCLTLGFEGRLRVEQGGVDKHLTIRSGLARIIRAQRGPVEQDLSPHWKGLDKPHRTLSAWRPVYLAVGVTALILSLMFGGLSYTLAYNADPVIARMIEIDRPTPPVLDRPAPPPPPPPPPPPQEGPTQLELVEGFLEPEITEGLVKVFQDPTSLTVRVKGQGMFGSGSDKLTKGYDAKIERLAKALNDQPGRILIVGHSDSSPIRTAKFPSNMHLSLARAESVLKQMEKHLDDPKRLSAEGRAEKEPIADNDTAEGRAENRRIEIVLLKAES
ncbi:MAG: type VI secretion system protein TssL, long form [Paracoccaceae bacterium]|nr:MAG: type VI secretion system protein TssL, long form [Paracoccaceae bacterium]